MNDTKETIPVADLNELSTSEPEMRKLLEKLGFTAEQVERLILALYDLALRKLRFYDIEGCKTLVYWLRVALNANVSADQLRRTTECQSWIQADRALSDLGIEETNFADVIVDLPKFRMNIAAIIALMGELAR